MPGFAPSTANRHLAALRGVLKECWRLAYVSAEDYQRAADLAPIRGTRLPRGRALPARELRALFASASFDPRKLVQAARDVALFAILYGSGLRRAEAIALDLADFDQQAATLRVRGKGNRERLAHLGDDSVTALEAWLQVRGMAAGPLFLPINRADRLVWRRLSGQGVLHIGRQRQRAAGIARFSPHDLRRTFISDLLDAGADLSTVQQLAGHAQIQTTARYDRRGEAAKKRAAGLLRVPLDQAEGRTIAGLTGRPVGWPPTRGRQAELQPYGGRCPRRGRRTISTVRRTTGTLTPRRSWRGTWPPACP